MRVHLGSDHAGLDLKHHLHAWLTEHGYEPVDHGPFVHDPLDDYPVFCLRAAEGVVEDQEAGLEALGVVVGGSGNGEQMAANKVAGARAALVWSVETARLAREHNDANVVSVGGRMHSLEDMTHFVEVFLTTPFSGDERHARRIAQMRAYEATRRLPPLPTSAERLGDA
ncbi:MAG TPA: ribose-5-phosphate isomerase [Nocardioides sp.]|uniref:ribose-5-phosphate isomerase n=1 Tax=Nocardioides sp. TaxID=35761 RepID=UPI002C5747FD|nr:ribose-5-phosphate isomerase [Nocardioides sp.]HQR27381.1 ribose-5-phosphate isomerase [Nocardioides sp.]